MRIALIDPSLFTVPYDRALAAGLAAAGHQVLLFGRAAGPDDPDPGDLPLVPSFYRIAGSRLLSRAPRRLQLGVKGIDHIASMEGLRRRLRQDPVDVIHFHWLPLPALDDRLLARFAGLAPLVMTVHDTAPSNGDPAAAVRQRGFYTCLRRFHGVIVHTEQGRARVLERGIDPHRVALLPHGLLDALPPAQAPDPMRGELTFVLFGKIKPYKGIDLMIEAFARLPPALRAQARLRVVGKPYMPVQPLQQQAERLGVGDRLTIEPRFVEDSEIAGLFGRSAVAIFPYREIEASGVLSLALVNARPVIATRVGNFAESIEDGRQGLLVGIEDVAALAEAMGRMITDRAFAAACSAEATALARLTPGWDEIGRRTAAFYGQAIERFRRREAA